MLLDLVKLGQAFLEANPFLVAMVIGLTEAVKRYMKTQAWAKDYYSFIVGILLGFAFAIPSSGFEGIQWDVFIAQGTALGITATGLYMAARSVVGGK